jgi:hypothetical protein
VILLNLLNFDVMSVFKCKYVIYYSRAGRQFSELYVGTKSNLNAKLKRYRQNPMISQVSFEPYFDPEVPQSLFPS